MCSRSRRPQRCPQQRDAVAHPRAGARRSRAALVGRNFGGYEIVSYIGDGPSGAVYRGEDLLGNAMAVKVLHAGLANRERTETLRDELMRLSALNEPVLQSIYDTGYGEEAQFFYATDELIGCDLDTALEDSGGLVPSKSYEIIRAVCHALELAHKEGVVHGGLRPRNVFLVPAERGTAVKVCSTLAPRVWEAAAINGILAGPSRLIWRLEQIGRAGATARDVVATPKSDLYALGVLICTSLFAGTLPACSRRGDAPRSTGDAQPAAPPTNVEPALGRRSSCRCSKPTSNARPASATEVLASARRVVVGLARCSIPERPAVVRRRGLTTLSGSIGPDSTARMSKFDALALAQDTLPVYSTQAEELESWSQTPAEMIRDSEAMNLTRMDAPMYDMQAPDEKRKTMTQNAPTNPSKSSSSSDDKCDPESRPESVEASLEDFISQANASFPAAADGWDPTDRRTSSLVDEDAGGIESAGLTAAMTKMPPSRCKPARPGPARWSSRSSSNRVTSSARRWCRNRCRSRSYSRTRDPCRSRCRPTRRRSNSRRGRRTRSSSVASCSAPSSSALRSCCSRSAPSCLHAPAASASGRSSFSSRPPFCRAPRRLSRSCRLLLRRWFRRLPLRRVVTQLRDALRRRAPHRVNPPGRHKAAVVHKDAALRRRMPRRRPRRSRPRATSKEIGKKGNAGDWARPFAN